MAHELVEPLGSQLWAVDEGEAEAAHGLPVVAPAPGEEARPDGLWRLKEAEQVVDELVREGADTVLEAMFHRRRFVLLAPCWHFVEHDAGAAYLACWLQYRGFR